MLKKFETGHVLGALNYVSQTERKLRSDLEEMRKQGDCTYSLVIGNQHQNLGSALENLVKAASDYEIVGLRRAVAEAQYQITREKDYANLEFDDVIKIHASLNGVFHTALNVLSEMSVYVLTRGSAEYISGEKVSFGADVEAKFPSAVYDTQEASKCLGLERWTACVMHCCRALEPALHALENAVPVKFEKEQWGGKIDQIEAAIKTMHKGTHHKDDVQWFSDTATQFHFMKNAWRNYSQHLLHTYDEERATEIYDAVRRFMRHLATRLSEEGTAPPA